MADNDTQTKVWAEHGWSAGYDDSGCPALRGPEAEFGGSEMLCYWDCGGSESMEVAQRIIAAHDVTVMALAAALDREERLREQIAAVEKVCDDFDPFHAGDGMVLTGRVRAALAGPGQKGDTNV